MPDHRDIAGHLGSWYTVEGSDLTFWSVENERGEQEQITVPLEWAVCPTCRGNGSHVNPSIDANGLAPEDCDEEFTRDYLSGVYDVPCAECRGRRVVPTSADPRFTEAEEEQFTTAYEIACEIELGY